MPSLNPQQGFVGGPSGMMPAERIETVCAKQSGKRFLNDLSIMKHRFLDNLRARFPHAPYGIRQPYGKKRGQGDDQLTQIKEVSPTCPCIYTTTENWDMMNLPMKKIEVGWRKSRSRQGNFGQTSVKHPQRPRIAQIF